MYNQSVAEVIKHSQFTYQLQHTLMYTRAQGAIFAGVVVVRSTPALLPEKEPRLGWISTPTLAEVM